MYSSSGFNDHINCWYNHKIIFVCRPRESVGVSPFQPSVPLDHSWNVAGHLHLTQVILIPLVAKEELKSCCTWTLESKKHVSIGILSWICFWLVHKQVKKHNQFHISWTCFQGTTSKPRKISPLASASVFPCSSCPTVGQLYKSIENNGSYHADSQHFFSNDVTSGW